MDTNEAAVDIANDVCVCADKRLPCWFSLMGNEM